MKTQIWFLALILFFSTLGLKAQERGVEKNSAASVPSVSQEDLKKATAEVTSAVKEEVAKAAKASAMERAAERKAVESLHKKELEAAKEHEKKLEMEAKLERDRHAKEVRLADEKVANEWRTTRYVLIGGLTFLLVAGGTIFLFSKKRENESQPASGPVLVMSEYPRGESKRFTNPDLSSLKEFAERNHSKEVFFVCELQNRGTNLDGFKMDCWLVMQGPGQPKVRCGNDIQLVSWKNHRARVAKLAGMTAEKEVAS